MRQNTMHAAALERFGGIDEIRMQTLPTPEIEPDEVLVRVEVAGVAVWDPFEREGGFAKIYGIKPHFPYILGSDGAGTIAEIGNRVRGLKVGDHVYGASLVNPKGGFYAEYIAVKAGNVSLLPSKLTMEEAGVISSDAMTARLGLEEMLHLKKGESLMIFGASGGIGHIAVQLAKRMGARVFAVASGDDGVALVKELGADAAVDGRKEDVLGAAQKFAPQGFDAALVTAGGESADRALTAMRNGGRVAHPHGVMPEPKIPAGVQVKAYDVEIDPNATKKLSHLVESGPLKVHVAQTFSLEQAAEAHRTLGTHFLGKLALRVN
jgi:NADPH:quinone reductase-like Zn-dependent oxidoreductase